MSVCKSISGSEIPEASDSDSLSTTSSEPEYRPGYATIPLHPCHPLFRERGDVIITEQNRKTFIQTPESVLVSVTEWGPSICFVKEELLTYELCKVAIENNDGAICSIKPHLFTKEEYYNLCLLAVKENGWNLKFIPEYVQTQELTDAAIARSCWAYRHSREEFKTPENSLSAIQRNGQIMEFVPRQFITQEMCEIAAKTRYPCLNHIPKEFLTKEICEMGVRANGENVRWVPDEFMSSDLAWIAINSSAPSNPSSDMAAANIQYISGKFLTKEIIVDSAKRWYCTYSRIPKECLTEDIEDAVLEVSPYCIKHMKQTPERCWKAFKSCPSVLSDCLALENITREMVEHLETLPEKKYIKRFMKKEDLNKIMSLLKK
jgi:hypothetical protein